MPTPPPTKTPANWKVLPFKVPTHVEIILPPLRRPPAFYSNPTMTIDQLDTEELSRLCDRFRDDVMASVGRKYIPDANH